ncbi:hypothetical protein [Falsiroseomonas selenitidurans]|uniref:XRE family transcriptional regulator n=1 Tax=Falsiroseomonas selenitidurans TaxID=2716335 RepID=A0ABX1DZB2_9PROT|nr:hypothetical protein [Falsiroseomonas selenitidurans]NKC30181.1 hypothetical protein [Falsiroseomonas selenitidurans]
MTTRQRLLESIDGFREQHGLTERQFSLMATRDHKWLSRLRRGQVSLSSIERAEGFMFRYATAAGALSCCTAARPSPDADAVQHANDQAPLRGEAPPPVRHPALEAA